jgi:UDP-2-acetamido-2,6-beta-L-arabino-hexul-4-ose reductase
VDVDASVSDWREGVRGAAAVFHLAGVNRPESDAEFEAGNVGSLHLLFEALDDGKGADRPSIVLASSTQAANDSTYGRSKLHAEQALEAFAIRTGTPAVVYRLPGVFGKWCRPHYNSVVATFCHDLARGLEITVSDRARVIDLVHVDDVVGYFLTHLSPGASGATRGTVEPVFSLTLGDLESRVRAFQGSRQTLEVPDASDPLTRRLYGTYMSYLPPENLPYRLARRDDARGTLAELLKSPAAGQMFVSRTRPGMTRGNHYHDLKVEKFCVLEGEAVIRFKSVLGGPVVEHRVSGTDFVVVDIPPGMTHNIENTGGGELIVLFWASEPFDQDRPDTHPCEVRRG